ncbi:glycoside hydrolase family 97 protein [Exilibacterium tricleocarpae]|uniref:Glycoside hydrolase family 97 protein n=1 Tax=Exilibacterium tricleocarpae TaxID=2591008 RepID=A0A545TSB0_9GAMM|nr:glycoside hydrolase family 97 protein [Exilibacterium tricleocarpae]TQV80099.1 glycoside hydrolase family 97 protein [Exilibacterium tricleocarpae]
MIDFRRLVQVFYRSIPAGRIARVAATARCSALFGTGVVAVLLLLAGCSGTVPQQGVVGSAVSPNGLLKVSLSLDDYGTAHYAVTYRDKPLLENSVLGLQFAGDTPQHNSYTVLEVTRQSHRATWEQPWGEQRFVDDHYEELLVAMQQRQAPRRKLSVRVRVFDDGLGLRYEMPALPADTVLQIDRELTEFKPVGDYRAWVTPALSPFRYEYLYESQPLDAVAKVHTPLTLQSSEGIHISIHEAALTDFASMILAGDGGGGLLAELVPRADGSAVKLAGGNKRVSPWRTIQVADNAAGLVESTLQLNLNEPNALADTAWIQPGKYVGVWWEMHRAVKTWGSGPAHGATTENTRRHIDFAARYGFEGVLVEGWNQGWDGNWLKNRWQFKYDTPYADFDLDYLVDYARQRNVGLILQNETAGGVANYEQHLAAAFKKYGDLGIIGVKTGYVAEGQDIDIADAEGRINKEWHHGQPMVNHFRRVVKEAAANKLMIVSHEPIKGTGIRRTFPNMMTREAARGQEYNAWSEGNPPAHTTILPFTRMLAGPMDFTPGIFDLLFESSQPETRATASIFENDSTGGEDSGEDDDTTKKAAETITILETRIHTTLAKQLALYVVVYSPLQMVPDFPENYEGHPMFTFVVDVPVDWAETRAINGEIGDYFTVARKDRDSEDWYIGSVTDENGRELQVPLDFLTPGVAYVADIYRDGDDADWRSRPLAYAIEQRTVTSADSLTIKLAPGGGQAVRLRPQ